MPDAVSASVASTREPTAEPEGRRVLGMAAISACLVGIASGAVLLAATGSWLADPGGAVSLATVAGGAAVALVSLGHDRRRWPVVVFLAYAASFGLLLAGIGATPEFDIGPQPWRDTALAWGGPQILVGSVWLVAGVVGIAVLAIGSRTARRRGGTVAR